MLTEKTVSLNEAKRRQQMKEAKGRIAARRAEREKRPGPNWRIFEVTLENLDQPILLSPTGRSSAANSAATRQLLAETEESSLFPSELSDGTIPPVDIVLEETERILADYVGLSR